MIEQFLNEIIFTWWFIFGFFGSVIYIIYELKYKKPSNKDLICLFLMSITPLNVFLGFYGYLQLITNIILIIKNDKRRSKKEKSD